MSDDLCFYLGTTGAIFKTTTFRMIAGQDPYLVDIKRVPWGNLHQSPVEIIKGCTGNTILEFRDDEDNVKGIFYLPEADKKNPFKRNYTSKHISERLQDVW